MGIISVGEENGSPIDIHHVEGAPRVLLWTHFEDVNAALRAFQG